MMKPSWDIVVVGLLLGGSAFALELVSIAPADDGVVDSIYELEGMFVENQYQYLPVSPPMEDVFVQSLEGAVPVDWKNFPPEFTKQMYAEMDANGYPLYRILVYEDLTTRQTVFLNMYGKEAYRLDPEKGYNPYAWQEAAFGVESYLVLDELTRWIYDPAHIAMDLVLVPQVFYSDYLLAQGLVVPQTTTLSAEPLAAETTSIPPLPDTGTNTNYTGGASSSNAAARLRFDVPADFGASFAEIFQKTNLVAGAADWSVLAENVAVTGGTERAWTDMASSNLWTRFYILNDPSKDFDGDFLNDGMEQFVTRSLTNNADSDGGQVPDGYEAAFGKDPNNSSDDAAVLADYLAAAVDPDGDASPNWVETRDGTNPHDRFD